VPDATDILHLRGKPELPINKPFVITLDGNGKPGQTFHPNTIFVSRRHAANHGSVHFVHNGLDPAEYEADQPREDYAVFLAKARWDVKNLPGAIQVARAAEVTLHVLGSRNWPLNLQRWLPAIRGMRYHGMIAGQAKRDLLARARCLIFPVRWEEPFGLALTEAMASGCYVAATPYGSLPEIVTPDVGVLSTRASELVEVVKNPGRFKPEKCRNHVLHGGFTHLDMARKYISYYEKVLTAGRLGEVNEPVPQTQPGFDANRLLPWGN
jgi:glycosyltransferase involved in cell wall biosynthesis